MFKIFKCFQTKMSNEDATICDFREGKYYEGECYGNLVILLANDGQMHYLQNNEWKKNFVEVDLTKENLLKIFEQAKNDMKHELGTLNEIEFAGSWINDFGNDALAKFFSEKAYEELGKEFAEKVKKILSKVFS